MTEHDDALWNPRQAGDPELQRLEALLSPYRADTRMPAGFPPRAAPKPRRHRRLSRVIAAGLAASLLLYAGHAYRLAWGEGQPWHVTGSGGHGARVLRVVAPGELLATDKTESLRIAVARIGEITLSPASTLQLIETRGGKHRVDLQQGHLRARIWAPPGHFGVADGNSEVVDLGCDFDLWKQPNGSGRVYVRSGWVAYRVAAHEVLVPAGFAMHFDAQRPSTPMRPEASPAFVRAVHTLERALLLGEPSLPAMQNAAAAVANAATDADAFTVLALLSRHPRLADTPLYPRLAQALHTKADDPTHRAAWAAGDSNAIDPWWERLPTSPKRWWANWADAFGT